MRRKITAILTAAVLVFGMSFQAAIAREGDCGYEGGISSGEAPNRPSYDYREVSFVTGEPIVFTGSLTLRKSSRQDSRTKQEVITSTYTYDLKNTDKSATLRRTLIYSTSVTKTDNGQLIEETVFSKPPVETIRIGSRNYTLKSFDFTRTRITDIHPAVNYHAGNLWGRKTYQTGTGAAAGGAVTVEITGEFYGFDQYWGSTEVQSLDYFIQGEEKKDGFTDRWGGTAVTKLSSTTTKDLRYIDNLPDQISFQGGFIQIQNNNSILEYESRLPEFDVNGLSTSFVVEKKDSLMLESFPVQTRLRIPSLDRLRGHPQEEDIRLLFSLGVLTEDEAAFKPEQYVTRAEFAAAMVEVAKEVPGDPALANKLAAAVKKPKEVPASPFTDVDTASRYYKPVKTVFDRGIMSGDGTGAFKPQEYITVAEAIMVLVRALGLEGLAPGPDAITLFKDNDKIPGYARRAAYVSERIGLITADSSGYLHPGSRITKAGMSVILHRFIDYMRNDIKRDYRERIVNY